MNILITGGSGFIGKHLVTKLLNEGHSIIILDKVKAVRDVDFNNENSDFVVGDITDISLMEELILKSDVIFHLASVVGVKNVLNNPLETIRTGVIGTDIILGLASKYKRKVILASTSEVYGKNQDLPLSENHDSVYGSTQNFRWAYAYSKALSEMISLYHHRNSGLELVIVRPFNVVGPGQTTESGMVIPSFIHKALNNETITVYGDGNQTRCFTHIKDVVDVLYLILYKEECIGNIYNIGNNEPCSILELAHIIKKYTDSNSNISVIPYEIVYGEKFEDIPNRIPDNSKIKEVLGEGILNTSVSTIIKDMIKAYGKGYTYI